MTKLKPWWSYWQKAEADVVISTGQTPFLIADALNDDRQVANTNVLDPRSHIADAVFGYGFALMATPHAATIDGLAAWAHDYYYDVVTTTRHANSLSLLTIIPGYDKHKLKPNETIISRFGQNIC